MPDGAADHPAALLIIHHSPGTSLPAMLDAALHGTASEGLHHVSTRVSAALDVTPSDVLDADGFLLVTPANLGYMSGALKHAFDVVYPSALGKTRGRPFGMLVHGESDTTGAVRSIEKITTGLDWRLVAEPVAILGPPSDEDLAACAELGAVVAATTLGF